MLISYTGSEPQVEIFLSSLTIVNIFTTSLNLNNFKFKLYSYLYYSDIFILRNFFSDVENFLIFTIKFQFNKLN